MGNKANEAFVQLIQKHRSPLCRDPEKMSMFSVNVDDGVTLGLFARHGQVILQLIQKSDDVELTITFNEFNAEEGVDSIVFSYNAFTMHAYVDKRKATKKGSMVFGMTVAEDEDGMLKELFEQLQPTMKHLCNLLVGMTLSVVAQIFKKEDCAISLADFGYT